MSGWRDCLQYCKEIFPFRRLVVIDLDLDFEIDIDDLYQEFESMECDGLVDFISVGRNFPNVILMC